VASGFFGAVGRHEYLQPNDQQLTIARDLLDKTGMTGLESRMYQRLSTGQKRRLLLARALVNPPLHCWYWTNPQVGWIWALRPACRAYCAAFAAPNVP